jgi:energy-coupling factor transport system ATP-binding protein
MKRLHREGIGIIHITHDINDIVDAKRLLVMDKGKIIMDGNLLEILLKITENQNHLISLSPVMQLLFNLKSRGWPLLPGIFFVEEAAETIHQLLSQKA